MGSQRTFDYDYLRDVIRQHPDWALGQVARAVTRHEREVRNDPNYGPILPNAIGSVKNRYRETWEATGGTIPLLKMASTVRTQPWAHVPKEYWDNTYLGYLRFLTRIDRGDNIPPSKARTAQNFAAQLREAKQVVDLRPWGEPYLRDARPDELDQEGNIVSYHSKFPGLSESQWSALGTPEMRAVASERYLTDFEGPRPMPVPELEDRDTLGVAEG